jgi:hypothetical protein
MFCRRLGELNVRKAVAVLPLPAKCQSRLTSNPLVVGVRPVCHLVVQNVDNSTEFHGVQGTGVSREIIGSGSEGW